MFQIRKLFVYPRIVIFLWFGIRAKLTVPRVTAFVLACSQLFTFSRKELELQLLPDLATQCRDLTTEVRSRKLQLYFS